MFLFRCVKVISGWRRHQLCCMDFCANGNLFLIMTLRKKKVFWYNFLTCKNCNVFTDNLLFWDSSSLAHRQHHCLVLDQEIPKIPSMFWHNFYSYMVWFWDVSFICFILKCLFWRYDTLDFKTMQNTAVMSWIGQQWRLYSILLKQLFKYSIHFKKYYIYKK